MLRNPTGGAPTGIAGHRARATRSAIGQLPEAPEPEPEDELLEPLDPDPLEVDDDEPPSPDPVDESVEPEDDDAPPDPSPEDDELDDELVDDPVDRLSVL